MNELSGTSQEVSLPSPEELLRSTRINFLLNCFFCVLIGGSVSPLVFWLWNLL